MSGMADVIAAHAGYGVLHSGDWTTTVTWHVYCEGLACDWDETLEGKAPAGKAFAAHVAEELAKAGFGNVQEAKRDALLEAADALEAGEQRNDGGERGEHWTCDIGYYGESAWLRQRAHSLDPEGHALVQAIHDRKAE